MARAFFFRKVPVVLFAYAAFFLFAPASHGSDSGDRGFVFGENGKVHPRIRKVIGDEGTEGSAYAPSTAVLTPEVPQKGKTDMPEAERCTLAESSCKAYEERMFQSCKRLQSPQWSDQEDCGKLRPEHFEYCMSQNQCG